MSKINEKLTILFQNFFKTSSNRLLEIHLFERDGTLILNQIKHEENTNTEHNIYGSVANSVESTLKQISLEYPGSFGTGMFETEDHKFIFTEAGSKAILLCVYEHDPEINDEMPNIFLITEKIVQLMDNSEEKVALSIPNLNVGEKTHTISKSKFQNFEEKISFQCTEDEKLVYKFCVLGDQAVGKTSLIQQFVTNRYQKEYKPTLGFSISNRTNNLQGLKNKVVEFIIWDIAGQKIFHRVRKTYYSGARAAFILYDITRRNTFEERIKYWLEDIRCIVHDAPIVIVGNKCDLVEERQVTEEEGRLLAKELNCLFIETSAKTGENVKDLFSLMGIELFFETKAE
ncbi:hypothetical protein NEF87_004258 [Candidatus Lokiarchaeum ossiferum]|uniref:GTP-binding protein n=1 Tax=Candidatus Lokiarchaeum ossiferum TaxID=2951803 RepID=A0ABY6HX74_9ARCH|nr:hypothetical protein NEF87_004258 [Candidatus Lokiarchaeum sp. B-35]